MDNLKVVVVKSLEEYISRIEKRTDVDNIWSKNTTSVKQFMEVYEQPHSYPCMMYFEVCALYGSITPKFVYMDKECSEITVR